MMRIFYLVPLLVISACVVRDCPEPEAPPPPQGPPGGGGPIVEPPPASGAVCGTRGAAECAPTEFCDFPDGTMCGAADQGGVCRSRPEACTMDYRPVCGCDGRTYGNECSAHREGVDVSARGECGAGGGGDPGATGGCVPGGCSGQLCVAQGEEAVTTCEWRPEYACYRSATCERQADGTCGWTQTSELAACLRNPPRE